MWDGEKLHKLNRFRKTWEYKNRGDSEQYKHPLLHKIPGMTGKIGKTSLKMMFEPTALKSQWTGYLS